MPSSDILIRFILYIVFIIDNYEKRNILKISIISHQYFKVRLLYMEISNKVKNEKHENNDANKKPSPLVLFSSFFYIGLFTIGGGLAMLPLIEAEFVNKRKFLTKSEMIDIFALAQSIPGVIAVNSSLLTGFKVAGIFGGIMAGIGVMLPSFIIILIISPIFERVQNLAYVNKAFLGIRGAIAALILMSAYGMGKQIIRDKFTTFIFLVSFILVVFVKINVIYVLLLSAFIGILFFVIKKHIIKPENNL